MVLDVVALAKLEPLAVVGKLEERQLLGIPMLTVDLLKVAFADLGGA